jgi:hypothetical protein
LISRKKKEVTDIIYSSRAYPSGRHESGGPAAVVHINYQNKQHTHTKVVERVTSPLENVIVNLGDGQPREELLSLSLFFYSSWL